MRTSLSLLLFLSAIFFSSCGTTQKLTWKEFSDVLQKSPETWSIEECNAVINAFTSFYKQGVAEKNASSRYDSQIKIYASATPLNKYVISARERKKAIQRRLSDVVFRERLKEELERYTNLSLDLKNKNLVMKDSANQKLPSNYSFLVYFENISNPYHSIEIDRADEGFFLENSKGDFSRVTAIVGNYINDEFILANDMEAIITFSAFTDEGTRLFPSGTPEDGYRLVFNGLQKDPVIIDWGIVK